MRLLKKAKQVLVRFALSTVLLTVSVPCITSYASDAATTLESQTSTLLEEIKTEDQYLQKKPDEDTEEDASKKLRDALADELKTKLNSVTESNNDEISISEGVNLIAEICDTVNAKKAFQNEWQNNFTEQAQRLGLPAAASGISGNDFLGWLGLKTSSDDIKSASNAVNLLRWDGDRGLMSNMMDYLDGKMTPFKTYLIALGYALCVSFSCLTLSEQVMDRKFTQESMTMTLLKMCLGLWVINNSPGIVGIMVQWGSLLIEKFTVTLTDTNINYALYKNALASSLAQTIIQCKPIDNVEAETMTNLKNLWNSTGQYVIGGMAALNLPVAIGAIGTRFITEVLGNGIIQLVSSFTIYSIIIEIMVRGIFVPIAVADLYNDMLRSSAAKYLKKILALCMTGVVIYAIVYSVGNLKNSMGFDLIGRAAINMSLLGMMARARSIAEDIVGAH